MSAPHLRLCRDARLRGGLDRVDAVGERLELGACLGRAREQLLERRAAEPALRLGDPVEVGLDLLDAVGLRFERGQKRPELARCFAQPVLGVAQVGRRVPKLRRELLERRQRVRGGPDERAGSLALVGRERLDRRTDARGELGDVAQTLALGAQALLGVGLEPLRVFDERTQLGDAGLGVCSVRGELLVPTARREQLAPRTPQVGTPTPLVVAHEGVEHVELVRRPREPALLELARHRDEPLGERRHVLASHAPPPGVRARPAVGEDPAREHEPFLVGRAELRERLELVEQSFGKVELGFDVRLVAVRADRARVAFRAEQQPDRLAQDRLAGAGLPRDRVQPLGEVELRLADQHEVLDLQATKQRCRGSG